MKSDGGQAFPHGDPTHGGDIGMSLRDYFAGQVAIGLTLAASIADGKLLSQSLIGEAAYTIADAMLETRDK